MEPPDLAEVYAMKIRIKFRKYGNLKFIGHLDVQRFFQKAVRRAGIDVSYSTGFSPHQIMSFAAPLGLGQESNGEYMDMEVNSFLGSRETVKRLNAVSVEGMEILSAKVLPEHAKNAMASVAAASYTVRFRAGREPDFDWKSCLPRFYLQESIPITKETKKSTLDMDLKPGIYELRLCQDAIYMLLRTGSAENIKPSLVLEAFLSIHGEQLKENALLITREETYMNIGTEENRQLVPLDEIGMESEAIEATDSEAGYE